MVVPEGVVASVLQAGKVRVTAIHPRHGGLYVEIEDSGSHATRVEGDSFAAAGDPGSSHALLNGRKHLDVRKPCHAQPCRRSTEKSCTAKLLHKGTSQKAMPRPTMLEGRSVSSVDRQPGISNTHFSKANNVGTF